MSSPFAIAVLAGALLATISPLMAQTGRLRIRVLDVTETLVTTATASLLGADDRVVRIAKANGVGEIVFTDLPFGDRRFTVVAPGFRTRPLTVTLRNGDEVRIDIALNVMLGDAMTVSAPAPEPKRAKRWPWLILT